MNCFGKADHRRWKSCNRNCKDSGYEYGETRGILSEFWGPSHKAKYSLMTDSEPVLWRKGEKTPGKGVKENLKPCAYNKSEPVNGWWRAFCRMNRRVILTCKVKPEGVEPKRKQVWIGRWVRWHRPETEWARYGQDEVGVKSYGGPNRSPFKRARMSCA